MSDPLNELKQQQAVIRTFVQGVAERRFAGFCLSGRPCTGKTHLVMTILNELNIPYKYRSGRLTPMGLFSLLAEQHDSIIVLDDASWLLENRITLQMLLAALCDRPGSTGGRFVTYRRQGQDETVRFTGRLIIISDKEPAPLLMDHVHYLRYDPTDEQITALMREIASKGHTKPKER
jgi:hypothetical protein